MMRSRQLLLEAEQRLTPNPVDAQGCLNIAQLAHTHGLGAMAERYRRAADQGTLVAETGAGEPLDFDDFTHGCLSFLDGDLSGAMTGLIRAHGVAPDDARIMRALARLQLALGKDDAALKTLTTAVEGAAESVDLRIELAGLMFRQGGFGQAHTLIADIAASERAGLPMIEELASAVSERRIERDPRYDMYLQGNAEAEGWLRYHRILSGLKRHENFVSYFHAAYRAAMDDLLLRAPRIRRVLNFGVLCGHSDFELAGRHRGVAFIGLDRNPQIKTLNESTYPAPNLSFVAANVLDALASEGTGTALTHLRTCECLYPDMVHLLYRTAAERGVSHIVCLEDWGYSRDTGRYLSFEEGTQPSTAFRAPLFLHDYPSMLRQAGYRVDTIQVMPIGILWKLAGMVDTHMMLVHAHLET